MTNLTRRALMAGTAAIAVPMSHLETQAGTAATVALSLARYEAFSPSPTLAEMQRLATLAESAYAEYDLIAASPSPSEAVESAAFNRYMDLEHRTRMVPADTVQAVAFKLRHLMTDTLWEMTEEWITEPIELAIADLERIGGAS